MLSLRLWRKRRPKRTRFGQLEPFCATNGRHLLTLWRFGGKTAQDLQLNQRDGFNNQVDAHIALNDGTSINSPA